MKNKKINSFSFIKFQTIMGALLGLILGIIYSFGGLILDILVTLELVTSSETPGLSYGTILAFGALIGMPIIFAGFGLLIGVIEVIVYNLFAKWTNKLDINFTKNK